MDIYKSKNGYFYRQYYNGKKKRISNLEYEKKTSGVNVSNIKIRKISS